MDSPIVLVIIVMFFVIVGGGILWIHLTSDSEVVDDSQKTPEQLDKEYCHKNTGLNRWDFEDCLLDLRVTALEHKSQVIETVLVNPGPLNHVLSDYEKRLLSLEFKIIFHIFQFIHFDVWTIRTDMRKTIIPNGIELYHNTSEISPP